MNAGEIRKFFTDGDENQLDTELAQHERDLLRIELVAQLAEANALAARHNELLDEQVGYQTETLRLQLQAVAEENDPGLQAARQVAMATHIPEVVALWNHEHPLNPIQIQRGAPPAGPRGGVRA